MYEALLAVDAATSDQRASTNQEHRTCVRKKVATGWATVLIPNVCTVRGKLLNVSDGGIGIMMDDPVTPHQEYVVECQVFLDGKYVLFNAQAVPVYCVLTGTNGYRVGLKFKSLDMSSTETVERFMAV